MPLSGSGDSATVGPMSRLVLLLVAASAAACTETGESPYRFEAEPDGSTGDAAPEPSPDVPGCELSFAKDIKPLLDAKGCTQTFCHGNSTTPSGGFDLTNLAGFLEGGQHGAAAVACDPAASNIVGKVSSTPPFGSRMPLGKDPLTAEEQDLLSSWIAQGLDGCSCETPDPEPTPVAEPDATDAADPDPEVVEEPDAPDGGPEPDAADVEPDEGTPVDGDSDGEVSPELPPTYLADVQPIFQKRCSGGGAGAGCHAGSTDASCAGGACFASSYAATQLPSYYCAGEVKGACTIVRIEDGSMPLDGGKVTTEEREVIQAWIDAGMPQE